MSATLPDDVDDLKALVLKVMEANHSLREDVVAKQSVLDEQQAEIDLLREQLRLLVHKRFGQSSEKTPEEQLRLFNEAEASADEFEGEEPEARIPVKGHTRARKGRRPLPESLPRVEVIHDLPEAEKICPHDGHVLKKIGQDTNEQLDFIPAKIQVIRHVRLKYACPECEQGVKIAPLPPQPIPKSMASPNLLAHVAVSKYADALPLYRQSKIFARSGIDLPRTTLANWMIRIGQLVQPLINLLRDEMLSGPYIQCDETRYQVLREDGKTARSQSYLWAQRGGSRDHPVILFNYDPSRSGEVPARLFEGYSGYLQTDGYKGYGAVCAANPEIRRVGCMAHARRKFDEALKAQEHGTQRSKVAKLLSRAQQGLSYIRRLYRIEKKIRNRSAEERQAARQERAQPILNEMKEWLTESKKQVPPRSLTGQALGYLSDQWEFLIRYVEDGRLEIDNNLIENAIRPFVLGRKNWLFSATVRGAESSANIYSLIETAKANRLEPYRYLCHVLAELPKAQSLEEIEALMPGCCAASLISAANEREPAPT